MLGEGRLGQSAVVEFRKLEHAFLFRQAEKLGATVFSVPAQLNTSTPAIDRDLAGRRGAQWPG